MSFYENPEYWIFMAAGILLAIYGITLTKDWVEMITFAALIILISGNGVQFGRTENLSAVRNVIDEIRVIEDTSSRSLLIFTASLVSYMTYNTRTVFFGLSSAIFTILTLIKVVPLHNDELVLELGIKILLRNIGVMFAICAVIKAIIQESPAYGYSYLSIPLVDTSKRLIIYNPNEQNTRSSGVERSSKPQN